MNTQTTMRTIDGRTWIKTESIPEDIYIGETKEHYLKRIGALKISQGSRQENTLQYYLF
jgi:hypothetical protein